MDAYFVGHPDPLLRENEGLRVKRDHPGEARHPCHGWQEGPMRHVSFLKASDLRARERRSIHSDGIISSSNVIE